MPTLEFKGKSFVYAHHLSVPFRELVIDVKKSLPHKGQKPALDDNLIIHGDNLHALKALLPVYAGKVDCIYIDPPYNTGNEGWCYNDNVRSPLMREWLKKSANPVEKEDLERHDKWLCMMWPRLKILRELLAEEGAIFVSIDDNEVHRLLGLMDEIFGEENHVATFTWVRKKKGSHLDTQVRRMTEYVVCYSKDNEVSGEFFGEAAYSEKEQPIVKRTNKQKVLIFPAGSIVKTRLPDGVHEPGRTGADGTALNFLSEIVVKNGVIANSVKVEGPFVWTQDTLNEEFRLGTRFSLSKRFGFNAARWDQEEKTKTPSTLLSITVGVGTNEDASRELAEMFGAEQGKVFSYPKPASLVEYLIRAVTTGKPDAVILDSFAGSGTTAHAVLALNKKDGGNRKFILVEMEDYADKLTGQRVRRVIEGYKFEGNHREELLREPLTWSKLQKATALVEKAESVEKFEGNRFDKVTKSVEDGALVVTGENKVTEKVEGLGGGFTFATLGPEMTLDKLLSDGLPAFEALAKYVFFTATGRTLSDMPKQTKGSLGFIGETDLYRVHLHYQPDKAWLQTNDAALTEELVDAMVAANSGKKKLLVFAAAKFMSQRDLSRLGVDFCQLPYAIHRILGD